MGILDSMFGGGQGQAQGPQGPQSPGVLGRMQAQYAPGAYEAVQRAQQQRAVYDAAMQSKDMSPQVAQALAMSPQFFQAQQGSYLPSAPQVTPITGADGSQTLVQTSNPGGGAGHGVSLSGIPITEPPGSTSSLAGAAGAAPAPEAGQGGDKPAPVAGSKNTLQGMPGSPGAIMKQIEANKAAGVDPTAGIPPFYKALATAVREGRETLKDITSQRGAQTKNAVNAIIQTMEPDFDENMNEARNTYRKQYVSEKPADTGGKVASLNRLAGHARAQAESIENMDNVGMGGFGGLAHPLNQMTNAILPTAGAGLSRSTDMYNTELSKYLSGSGDSGQTEREARKAAFDPQAGKSPQEMGAALLKDVEFIEKQKEGYEQHRDAVFKGTPVATKQFEIISPQAQEHLNVTKIKAHKMLGDYDEWSKSPDGQKTTGGAAPPGGMPPGWKYVK